MQTAKRSTKIFKPKSNGGSGKNTKALVSDAKLLKLWRIAALERAGYKCEYPDCNINYTQLHCHHIYHRSHISLRWDLRNAIILCPTHHVLGSLSAHKNPDFKDIIMGSGVRSEGFFDDLRIIRNQVQKNTLDFRWECYEKLKPYL